MTTVQTYKSLVDERVNEIIAKAKLLDEDTIRWKPSENAWSIMEVMCHVEEFINFWFGEIGNVLQNSSVHFGRKLNEQERSATVAKADNRTVDEILKGLEDANLNALKLLSKYNTAALQVESQHVNPKFGMKPMTFVLDKFVLEHLSIHLSQMERNLRTKKNNEPTMESTK
ncbi:MULTISPECIES: DinB family protein [unclassified Paenibacillus]|uniref:DinB family protein n=1 Tax=unclassified Paenibacillus TaxID=185978 RepID=UPI001AE75B84|nr:MULTISPECIES: DinB family protein [unclassified Paenibacillus]MBP1155405.1 hypothetical protein [Paenibacillus sp. PvP091]MBP1169210.1 hypothetical protein [Paenibacillus sp. PvR098]MBP2440238.1 hypothetical protein [Paenibacillus sp. PvP052]